MRESSQIAESRPSARFLLWFTDSIDGSALQFPPFLLSWRQSREAPGLDQCYLEPIEMKSTTKTGGTESHQGGNGAKRNSLFVDRPIRSVVMLDPSNLTRVLCTVYVRCASLVHTLLSTAKMIT